MKIPLRFFYRVLCLSLLLCPAVGALADAKANALLQQVEAKTRTLQSLTAEVQETYTQGKTKTQLKGTARLMKPNLYRVQLLGKEPYICASDGMTEWRKSGETYRQQSLSDAGSLVFPLSYFFTPMIPHVGFVGDTRTVYAGQIRDTQGVFDVVEVHRSNGKLASLYRLFIGQDKLIHRAQWIHKQGLTGHTDIRLTHLAVNTGAKPADFAFTPKEMARFTKPRVTREGFVEPKPLAVGEQAPDFTLPTPTGQIISLKDILAGKKLVVLYFWFYHCSACHNAFPEIEKLHQNMKDKGVAVFAVNFDDSPAVIQKYMARNKLTMPVLRDAQGENSVAKKYRVWGYPTTCVLDGEGKILLHSLGGNGKHLRMNIEKMIP